MDKLEELKEVIKAYKKQNLINVPMQVRLEGFIKEFERQQQEKGEVLRATRELINQVKSSKYSDENGHWLEMNDAYYKLVCLVGEQEN